MRSYFNNKLHVGIAAGFFSELYFTRNTFIAFEILKAKKLFSITIDSETEGDHKSYFLFKLELFYFILIDFSIKDIRHWNYKAKRFYKEGEEMLEYVMKNHEECLTSFEHFLKEEGWYVLSTKSTTKNSKNTTLVTYTWKNKSTITVPGKSLKGEEFAKQLISNIEKVAGIHKFDVDGLINKVIYKC